MFHSDLSRDLFAVYCDERRDALALEQALEDSAARGGGRRGGHGVYHTPRIPRSFDEWMRDEGIRLEICDVPF